MNPKYDEGLKKLLGIQKQIKDIHPALSNLYPVAFAEDSVLYIFESDEPGKFEFRKSEIAISFIPPKVLAAFPLRENDYKMTCLIHSGVFDTDEGYVFIFHEFFHCHQFHTVELDLKAKLDINTKAMKEQNWMWELNYPFPYEDSVFTNTYSALLKALSEKNYEQANILRNELKQNLNQDDYDYMTWQEWKEGSARWIENRIRARLGIEENHSGKDVPFNRVTFYEGGSSIIEMIVDTSPETIVDLEKLYQKIKYE
ncbi:MAG: hypothetical protein A2V66_11615 [Ignavibacteria bacterium RBG_13_36_8]|nr:MAG: hypothetical protein A2V66_11615 [Ignavibacteria bacterium RBG_13_36_8]